MHTFARFWKWLKWPLALAILGYLYHANRAAIDTLADGPKHWGLLFVAFLLCGGALVLTFLRWGMLSRAQRFDVSTVAAVRVGFLGMLASTLGPGDATGDVVRAVYLARKDPARRVTAVATVLLDRVAGLVALVMVGGTAALFYTMPESVPELRLASVALWGASLAGLAGLALLLHPAPARWNWINRLARVPRVGPRLEQLLQAATLFQTHRISVAIALLMGLAGHLAMISGFYCCALALSPWTPGWGAHFFILPIAQLFSMFIPLPGGVGVLEGAIGYLYRAFTTEAVTSEAASAAGIVAVVGYRLVSLSVLGAGSLFGVAGGREARDGAQPLDCETKADAPEARAVDRSRASQFSTELIP